RDDPLLLNGRGGVLQVGSAQRAPGLCDRQQRRVELHACGVHSAMLGMTAIAIRGGGYHLRSLALIEAKECPLAREAGFVFDMDLDSHDLGGLEVALLVDRGLPFRAPCLQHHHRLVRPGTGFDERLVSLGIYEDVVEHVVIHGRERRVITHVEPGREIDPLPVILGQLHLAIAGELGRHGWRGLPATKREGGHDNQHGQQSGFRRNHHAGQYPWSGMKKPDRWLHRHGAPLHVGRDGAWAAFAPRWLQGSVDWLHFPAGRGAVEYDPVMNARLGEALPADPGPSTPDADRWLWIASFWLGIGLFDATQTVFVMRAEGMHHHWTSLFLVSVLSWLPWATSTPLVLRLGRRLPATRWSEAGFWVGHVSACAAIGLV